MHFTLRQLQVFLATAQFENITRAADSLAMSQSAASSALKELETQYNVRLFDRAGKRLKLNELGRLLRPQAEALLAQAQDMEQAFAKHQKPGDLNIGATLTIGNYIAVGLMAEYMAQNPGAKVNLEVANTQTIVDKVLHFELDMGLIEGELNHSDLDVYEWMDDDLVIFTAPDHPLAQRETVTDEDLLAEQWIVREPGSGTRQAFDRAMHGILPELTIRLELQHTEAIKRAVQEGLGVGCLSEITLQEAFGRKSLVPIAVPHRQWDRKFYFILHRHKYRSAGIERWLDLCRKSIVVGNEK
ncbi:LysR family transcriptional regulator [Marinibactrum halimedae]|uniref:LysR family transcriptional regulator n=1 Tax=Marinibactrum halimedae TaxID=1444977 RepID=A0AA37TCQ8_9GAMM|nr:LysR family transcriptional regulator [Marinibactrum halimedae]MCD9460197.1 LysR family transcriptional regulator [Marinibactrum halimedae]GLS27971.1 LysR family transcriptional regulator [Marinibactrum halimedae]